MIRTRSLVALALVALAGCHHGAIQGTAYDLAKEVYVIQANEHGEVGFQLPGFDADREGIPLVATYESSDAKLDKLYLVSVPHTLDTLGHVYVETEPLQYVAIVVVRPRRD
ncbi:MAG: hypothetical protein GTN69_01850 [Armatimonadetes bacterium]|nr:hypothetical protein [Armatimonadota bacterium]